MFDIIGTVFPMLVIFLLLRGILQTILRSGRRGPQQEQDEEYEEEGEPEEQEAPARPAAEKKPDLAAEFERRLKKTSDSSAAAQSQRTDKQRVHRDNEAPHESKGRIHKEGEALAHDKGKVYYDPKGDYSYNEERFNAQAAAFRASRAVKQVDAPKQRLKLKHGALVQGFIMSQVLDKPRCLKPYGSEEQL